MKIELFMQIHKSEILDKYLGPTLNYLPDIKVRNF
jgi:hypothetical protein